MNKIIILGAGSIGGAVAEHLAESNEVTVIDNDPERLSVMRSRFDARFLLGSADSPALLGRAGAEDADIVLAVTEQDATNLAACRICRTLYDPDNVKSRIVRLRNTEIVEQPALIDDFGATLTYNPEVSVANFFINAIGHPGVNRIVRSCSDIVSVAQTRLEHGSAWIGRTIGEVKDDKPELNMYIGAIRRDGKYTPADQEAVLQAGDELVFTSPSAGLAAATMHLCGERPLSSKLFIGGGESIGATIAARLENQYAVVLFEMDPDLCAQLARDLDTTLINNADPTVASNMRSEDIEQGHYFCAVSKSDEVNIMSALLARYLGCDHTGILINRNDYQEVLAEHGIDLVVSPSEVTVGILLAQLSSRSHYEISEFDEQGANVTSFEVRDQSDIQGQRLCDVNWPANVVPCAITRGEANAHSLRAAADKAQAPQIFLPDSDQVIEQGDRCVVFIVDKNTDALNKLADIPFFA